MSRSECQDRVALVSSRRPGFRGASVFGLLAAALMLAAAPARAQWEAVYGVPDDDRSEWVIETSGGGFVHVGGRVDASGVSSAYVIRTNSAGSILWERLVGATGEWGHRVVQTQDGGFVVAGSTFFTGVNQYSILLFKLDGTGNLLWAYAYRGFPSDVGGLGVGLTESRTGDLIVCARWQLFTTGFAQQAMVLFRTTPNGILQWHRSYRDLRYGANTFASLADVHELADGTNRIVASGYTMNNFPGDREATLCFFSSAGAPLAAVAYNHLNHADWTSALEPAANGDFLLAGYTKSIGEGGGTWLMRTNPVGAPLWYHTFRLFQTSTSMEELPNSDIILAGTTFFQPDDGPALLSTNAGGFYLWSKKYGGASTQEYGECVAPTSDGGFMLNAWTNSYGAGSFDLYAIKTNGVGENGCEQQFAPEFNIEQIPHENFQMEFVPNSEFQDLPLPVRDPLSETRFPCRRGCVEPPERMVAWYPLDEPMGPIANDIAFNNDGRHISNPTPAPGVVDGGLCFNGQSSYVEAPDAAQINFGISDFSIDAWIRTTDTNGVRIIVDKRTMDGTGTAGYSFYTSNGLLGFQLADGTGSNVCSTAATASCTNYISTAFVADGAWHHVAVTVDRSSTTGGVFYVDGFPLAATFDPTFRPGSVNNTGVLRIGSRSFAVSGVWNGCIDEVEIFRRALTPGEVLDIFNAGALGKCKDKCHVPWDSPFCRNATSIVVKVTICNCGPTPQTYNLALVGLPANPPGCTIAGPTVFTILDPVPVTIPPRTCQDIRVRIQRPAGMTAAWQIACFDAIITNLTSGRVMTCHGSVQDRRDWCVSPVIGTIGVATLLPNVARDIDVSVTNNTASPTLSYRLNPVRSDMAMGPIPIGINGLPPGVPWEEQIAIAPGATEIIPVRVMAEWHEPFEFFDVVVQTDENGDGEPEALLSIGLKTVPDGCPGQSLAADMNCDCVINNFDIDPFVFALIDPAGYQNANPNCPVTNADCNGDGAVDNFDIDAFVQILIGP
ncbi:MAG: LamG domain-containing protein [Phycisphaerae bacterium]